MKFSCSSPEEAEARAIPKACQIAVYLSFDFSDCMLVVDAVLSYANCPENFRCIGNEMVPFL